MPGEPEGAFVLPVGTVTLLLSDFEGSVRAWQAEPDAMAQVVGELEALVDDVVGRHGGVRPAEQGEGDSFVAAFSRATEAVAAALEIQLGTLERTWPADLTVCLRMALHTGEAQLRGEKNYMGTAINRCARLRALAHGGQVLLSGATHDLVADHHHLADVDLADLGTHRLRDLARPEHVYQLRHPALRADFPPLRGLDVVPNNLPTQLTTFIGRTTEVADVARLLGENRLVTLTGSGGCGKTRLALQAAAEVSANFPDGVRFADLAPIGEADAVPVAVATALGTAMLPGQSPLDAVVARAHDSTLLVVLDNCEHLIEGCCALVAEVLRACPDVRILATSREVLGVAGEVPWRVPSLPLPEASGSPPVEALTTSDAVRLFVDRAVKARPNFTVTNETAADVAAICRRLDGIPLAIELAAARVRVLSPAQIAAGLDDRFRLLGGGARTALARQQTLAASVAWSHDLLIEEERVVFRRLSVFSGPFDLDAAEAVAAGDGVDAYAVLDILSALVDKSLVLADDEGVSTRYRMLETLRAFARNRLVDTNEVDAVYRRTAAHYLARAASLDQSLYAELARDAETIRAVLDWALLAAPDMALELAVPVGILSMRSNDLLAARRWFEEALARDPGSDPGARARVLAELAYACWALGDIAAVPSVAAEAIELGRAVGDDRATARALNARGWAMGAAFSVENGAPDLEEAVGLARRSGDAWCEVDALTGLGYITSIHADPREGRKWLEQAGAAARAAGDIAGLAGSKGDEADFWLAWCDTFLGNLCDARARFERVLRSMEARGDAFHSCMAHAFLSVALANLGEIPEARAHVQQALAMSRPAGTQLLWLATNALTWGCFVELAAGDLVASREFGEEGVAVMAEATPPAVLATLLVFYAVTMLELGDDIAAEQLNDQVVELAAATPMPWPASYARLNAARLAAHRGERGRAEDLAHEVMAEAVKWLDPLRTVESLELVAALAAESGSSGEAARLLGAAGGIRERVGYVPFVPHRARLDELQSKLRAELGDEEFDQLRDEGAALDLEAAVAYAQRGRGERKRPSSGWSSLTPTELEVVRLVARGLTNPQVAEKLFITRATVKAHLGHIFPKLGVTTRAELAALATRHGIESGADLN